MQEKKDSSISVMLKGICVGGTMLVPGCSGGSMAMILGVYDRLVSSVSSFMKHKKESLFFLTLFCLGGGLGMILFARPMLSLIALAITLGTPRFTTWRVVRMQVSIFSPIPTITVSQFWIPISSRTSILSSSATYAFSVYCLSSFTLLSQLSTTITSFPASARLRARAEPKRPRPITP